MPRVLVIDDDLFTAEVVRAAVPEWTVETAADGLLALDTLRHARASQRLPDLILLDIQMPGITGYETCVTIRLLLPDIPIVPYTASSHIRAAYLSDLGCHPVLYKGMHADALRAALADALATPVPLFLPTATLMELSRLATLQEEQARQERANARVVLLASSLIERMGLKLLIDAQCVQVLAAEATAADLRPTVVATRCAALIAPMRDRQAAVAGAVLLSLPVLFVVERSSAGWALLAQLRTSGDEVRPPTGVLLTASLPRTPLAQVIQTLAQMGSYRDPALDTVAPASPEQLALYEQIQATYGIALTERQTLLLMLEARGFDMHAIATQLGLSSAALYQLRHRLAASLHVAPKQLRRIALDTLASGTLY